MKSHAGAVSSDPPAMPHPATWLTSSTFSVLLSVHLARRVWCRPLRPWHPDSPITEPFHFSSTSEAASCAGPGVSRSPPVFPGLGLGLRTEQILGRDLFEWMMPFEPFEPSVQSSL